MPSSPSAHWGMEDGLPTHTLPVNTINDGYKLKDIYDGYLQLIAAKKPGETSIKDQVAKHFGIKAWEWPRLKRVYEAALAGIGPAADFVRKIDAGELKISQAYEAMKLEQQQQAEARNLPKRISVPKVYDHALRDSAYAENVALALRTGASVDVAGMSSEEVDDCAMRLRAAALYLKDIADHIGRSSGGKK